MPYTKTQADWHTSKLPLHGPAPGPVARLVSVIAKLRRAVAARRALAELTSDQLKDIGYPETSRATLNVKAGLITNLNSMR